MADGDKLKSTGNLLNYGESPPDCSFVIGAGIRAKTIGAHKSVLSRASTVFKSMFNGNYKESDDSFNIPLPNVVDFNDFKVILEYIYYKKSDSLQFLSLQRLKHVAYLADYYLLDNLLTECHTKFEKIAKEKYTSFHDFLQIFEYERKFGRKIAWFRHYTTYCDYRTNFPYSSSELLGNTSIYNLEPLYFYDLLKLVATKLREIERFCLIENYARIHGLEMDVSNNMQNNSVDADSETPTPSKTLKDMFDLIDFKKMNILEFQNGPAVSDLWIVGEEEKLKILKIFKNEILKLFLEALGKMVGLDLGCLLD